MREKSIGGKTVDSVSFLGESVYLMCQISNLKSHFRILNKDEAKKVFNTYHVGYDLAKFREQLNVGDDILNEAAAADNDDNAP